VIFVSPPRDRPLIRRKQQAMMVSEGWDNALSAIKPGRAFFSRVCFCRNRTGFAVVEDCKAFVQPYLKDLSTILGVHFVEAYYRDLAGVDS
jgi:hypothetical protein